MRPTRWWWALGAVALAACRAPSRSAAATRDSSAGPSVDPTAAPGQVTLALWQLRAGVTLGEWAASRTGEQLEAYNREANRDYLGDWCARATADAQTGARIVHRVAYFYPPPRTPGQALPGDDASPDSLRAHCLLGLVATQVVVPDSLAGARLADSITGELTSAFGGGNPRAQVSFFGSAFWRRVVEWQRGDLVMVSALSGLPYASAETAARWSVVTFAFLPVAHLTLDPDHDSPEGLARVADTLPLARVARLARPDTAPWVALRGVLAGARLSSAPAGDGGPPATPPSADSLVHTLRRWVLAAAGLPPPRRAAALFVADQVLDRSLCAYGLCGRRSDAELAPLKQVGAKFTWSARTDSWVYRRNWLYEARTLDRDSPVGQAIFLLQLAQGFDPSGTCELGGVGFQRVLDNGERYLARVPDGPISAPVHFYLGEAYHDIVALADGAADSFAASSTLVDQAPEARRQALLHYRAAMAGATDPALADLAWRRGWWLLAGLPMRDVRFLCLND